MLGRFDTRRDRTKPRLRRYSSYLAAQLRLHKMMADDANDEGTQDQQVVGSMLYLYDTINRGRDKRAKAAGLAWRSFALNLGMQCKIRVISLPLPEQPNDWACGYLIRRWR
ncbi:hypothetical protein Trco_006357 [Trichoderma cornu-damae]|uniref:Uncharacterized protein n=1 Tax=Trichoderma cornu-damae TaxID=654480 RepID=A0A9P8QKA5_9HYPO|nr:hypothetical protein Trco_006357 [Trichoderma cornu-damae]